MNQSRSNPDTISTPQALSEKARAAADSAREHRVRLAVEKCLEAGRYCIALARVSTDPADPAAGDKLFFDGVEAYGFPKGDYPQLLVFIKDRFSEIVRPPNLEGIVDESLNNAGDAGGDEVAPGGAEDGSPA